MSNEPLATLDAIAIFILIALTIGQRNKIRQLEQDNKNQRADLDLLISDSTSNSDRIGQLERWRRELFESYK